MTNTVAFHSPTAAPGPSVSTDASYLDATSVAGIVGMSYSALTYNMKRGKFPRPAVPGGPNRLNKWHKSQVREWLTQRHADACERFERAMTLLK